MADSAWIDPLDPASRARFRRAVVVTYVCIAIHLAAALAAQLYQSPGSTLHTLDERAPYIATHIRDWRTAWLMWTGAALALIAFYMAFSTTLSNEMRLVRHAAVLIGLLGVVPDLGAQYVYALVLPDHYVALTNGILPRGSDSSLEMRQDILGVEARAELLTGALANGLYTIAGVLLTYAAAATRGFPKGLVWASLPAWISGVGLTTSVLLQAPRVLAVCLGALMVSFTGWLVLMLLAFWRRATRTAGNDCSPPESTGKLNHGETQGTTGEK